MRADSIVLRVIAAGISLALAAGAYGQHGALTMPRNLADLTDRAALIVEGRVVSAVAEPLPKYPNLNTVVVTIAIQDTLKGTAERIHTFRQYVWDPRDTGERLGYRKGQHVLLLLNPVNENGLTSPVGLEQGRFRIEPGPKGELMATNGAGNQGLMRDVAAHAAARGLQLNGRAAQLAAAQPAGPIRARDLKDMIRQLAGTQ